MTEQELISKVKAQVAMAKKVPAQTHQSMDVISALFDLYQSFQEVPATPLDA